MQDKQEKTVVKTATNGVKNKGGRPKKRDGDKSIHHKFQAARTKRAQQLRKEGQQATRDKIAAANHHHQLLQCAQMFGDIQREVKSKRAVEVTREYASQTALRISSLTKKAEIHHKLLNKYLPDMRHIEMGTDDETVTALQAIGAAFAGALAVDESD